MRKTLGIIFKILLISFVAIWMFLLLIEFSRYKKNEPMLFIVKEDTISYDDGHVYVYWGLGYKEIIYERTSIYGKEFGHMFITVREKVNS